MLMQRGCQSYNSPSKSQLTAELSLSLFCYFVDTDVYFDMDVDQTKNGEGKGGKYLEKENIWSTEEKKNVVGKRNHFEKEN